MRYATPGRLISVRSRAAAVGMKKRWNSGASSSSSSFSSSSSYLNGMFSLEGRCCIVTGGGTGIGAALAEGLVRAGGSVVLVGRRQSVLEEAADRIQDRLDRDDPGRPRRAFCSPCDVTDYSVIESLVEETEFLTGLPPTVLVNNAGINVRQKAEDLTSEHWQLSLELMLTAPFMLTRALAGNMRAQKHGRVLNIASLQSLQAFPDR